MTLDPYISPVPIHLHSGALPVLYSTVNDYSTHSSPESLVRNLRPLLEILSYIHLYPTDKLNVKHPLIRSTIPLEALLHLSILSPRSLNLPLLISGIIAYPGYPQTISIILDAVIKDDPKLLDSIRTEIIPTLISRLRLSPSFHVVHVLHLLIRANEKILGIILTEADYVLPGLRDSYNKLGGIKGKSESLLVCHALLQSVQGGSSKEALMRLMGESTVSSSKKSVLIDLGLKDDYEAIFEGKASIGDNEVRLLQRLRDEAIYDPVC